MIRRGGLRWSPWPGSAWGRSGSAAGRRSPVGDIEGVLGVPGGVVLGEVQGLEVIVVGFHLRALHHIEAHPQEDLLDLVQHQGEGMPVAGGGGAAGHGDVDGLGPELFLQLGGLQGLGPGGQLLLQGFPDLVGQLPDDGALLGGKAPHLLEDGGELPLLSQELDPQVFQLLQVPGGLELLVGRFPDGFQSGFHGHYLRLFCDFIFDAEKRKTPAVPSKGRKANLTRSAVPPWFPASPFGKGRALSGPVTGAVPVAAYWGMSRSAAPLPSELHPRAAGRACSRRPILSGPDTGGLLS